MATLTSVEHQAASVGRVPAMGKWQTAQAVKLHADDVNGVLRGMADGHIMLEYWLQWDTCKGGHRHDTVSARMLTGVGFTPLHLHTVPCNDAGDTLASILSARVVKLARECVASAPVQIELTE